MARAATTPMTMPAMAPPESELEDDAAGDGVGEGLLVTRTPEPGLLDEGADGLDEVAVEGELVRAAEEDAALLVGGADVLEADVGDELGESPPTTDVRTTTAAEVWT